MQRTVLPMRKVSHSFPSRSQMRAVPSSDADNSRWPSAENSTAVAGFSWPGHTELLAHLTRGDHVTAVDLRVKIEGEVP